MNPACLIHHHWVGCRCERCGQLRDQAHDWDGCRCRLCELVRDAQHDLVTADCRVTCRRCGRDFGEGHDWAGCVCRHCKATKPQPAMADHDLEGCLCRRCGRLAHDWRPGVCRRCGERCLHLKTEVRWSIDSGESVGGYGTEYCTTCGTEMRKVRLN